MTEGRVGRRLGPGARVRLVFAVPPPIVAAGCRHGAVRSTSPSSAAVSRSPRRVLRTAAEAVDAVFDLCARYPEARAEIVRALGGEESLAAVDRARVVLHAGAEALPGAGAGGGGPGTP